MRSLITAACLLILPVAAQAEEWRVSAGSTACSATIEDFVRDHGKRLQGRPVERNQFALMSEVIWGDGTRERIIVAQRGEDGFCVLARHPITSPGA